MLPTVEAIQKSQLVDQGGGWFTASILDPTGITTRISTPGQPDTLRPAVKGDVLSLQPGGSWEGRVPGTNGAYERLFLVDGCAVYTPEGSDGPARKVAYAGI